MTNTQQAENKGKGPTRPITPDLVRKVTDKVYALWQQDFAVDRERRRLQQRK